MVRRNPVQNVGRTIRRLPLMERRGARRVRTMSTPPPVGGWNARDALANMKPTDAIKLRNWFPRQSDVIGRPGFSSFCATGESGTVQQLIPYEAGGATKLLAAVSGKFFDVTSGTASSLATGLTDDDWSYDYLAQYVLMANGSDVVKSYNGTAIASPAFTGVTLSTLCHVSVYKSRAYFCEVDSQSMWYGGVGSVAGALTEFDFSTVAPIEGDICFTSHLKGDGGDGGANDVFFAVFYGGDVLAYSGSNPGDPTNWELIGHYKIGRPMGRLAYAAADDDVYVITNRGFEKVSELVKFGDSAPASRVLSNKIQKEVSADLKSAGASIDWRVHVYPLGQMLIFTSPQAASSRRYFVQNINTGAWCEFGDFRAFSWAVSSGVCYFGGSNGTVYKFDDGTVTDAGTAIRADAQVAWTKLGDGGLNKRLEFLKFYFYGTIQPAVSANAGADYQPIGLGTFAAQGETVPDAVWDTAVWDTAQWGYGERAFEVTVSRNALGKSISYRLAVDISNGTIAWNDTVYLFTVGGPI